MSNYSLKQTLTTVLIWRRFQHKVSPGPDCEKADSWIRQLVFLACCQALIFGQRESYYVPLEQFHSILRLKFQLRVKSISDVLFSFEWMRLWSGNQCCQLGNFSTPHGDLFCQKRLATNLSTFPRFYWRLWRPTWKHRFSTTLFSGSLESFKSPPHSKLVTGSYSLQLHVAINTRAERRPTPLRVQVVDESRKLSGLFFSK